MLRCRAAGWRCRSAPGSQPWMPQCLRPQGLRPLVRARRGARRALPASACARLRAPRFLRVDDEFQQLRWSWNIDHVLLIDEIAEVEWHGGARCTVHYHATHSSLEHQTLAWTLAFAKQHKAATWVSVLRLLGSAQESALPLLV